MNFDFHERHYSELTSTDLAVSGSQGPIKKCTILAENFTKVIQETFLYGGLKSISPNSLVKINISFSQEAFDSYFKNLVIALQ